VFITEVTFGLPVYRWRSPEIIFKAMYDWWQTNRLNGQPSVLFGYSLGKAQRLLAGLNKFTDHPILVHGALLDYNDIYRDHGIEFPDTEYATDLPKKRDYGEDLIVAPPSAFQSNWMKRFDNPSTALASGWMQIRGIRRRRGYDTGFVLSDHADWPALIQTVEETGANQVFATHGDTDSFCRYLNEETDIEAHALESLTTD
jgi:putative mRNA 3-end processing factor